MLEFDVAESRRRTNKSALAREGRKLLAAWRREVEAEARAGVLIDIDTRLADALMNFPSSTLYGYAWAGQKRLAATLQRSIATIGRGVSRFKRAQLLHVKQRGHGLTSRYTFCIKGELVFGSGTSPVSGQGTSPVRDLKPLGTSPVREDSNKPIDSYKHESPPNPPTAAAQSDGPQGYPSDYTLQGEVLGPEGEATFDKFFKAAQENPGPTGPALAHWRKLTADDRRAVGTLIGPRGISLDGMWACTWLADRRWERERLRSRSIMGALDAAADRLSGLQRTQLVTLNPYSEAWTVERARKVDAGEPVSLMDNWARDGRSWVIRVTGPTE